MIVSRTFVATHATAGLPGFPAIDLFAAPGTPLVLTEDVTVTRHSGHDPELPPPLGQGGPWGLSLYAQPKDRSRTYYLTHLSMIYLLGECPAGMTIGIVGDYPGNAPGADHVHVGLHQGDSPEAHYPSKTFPGRCYLPAHAPPRKPPAPKPPTRGTLPGPVPKPQWFWPALKKFFANRKKPA